MILVNLEGKDKHLCTLDLDSTCISYFNSYMTEKNGIIVIFIKSLYQFKLAILDLSSRHFYCDFGEMRYMQICI